MEKTRYYESELKEFQSLIIQKLSKAREELDLLNATLSKKNNGTDDTSWSHSILEDGQATLSREETAALAYKQEKFISGLERALMRIENKTYGICIATSKLIPRERLLAMPHATMIIEEKRKQGQ